MFGVDCSAYGAIEALANVGMSLQPGRVVEFDYFKIGDVRHIKRATI